MASIGPTPEPSRLLTQLPKDTAGHIFSYLDPFASEERESIRRVSKATKAVFEPAIKELRVEEMSTLRALEQFVHGIDLDRINQHHANPKEQYDSLVNGLANELHNAIQRLDFEKVQLLVNAPLLNGKSLANVEYLQQVALHVALLKACGSDHEFETLSKIIELLIPCTNLSLRSNNGQTFLQFAVINGTTRSVALLLSFQPIRETIDAQTYGYTALMDAITSRKKDTVDVLLTTKANPNLVGRTLYDDGTFVESSALSLAVRNYFFDGVMQNDLDNRQLNIDIIESLLEHQVNKSQKLNIFLDGEFKQLNAYEYTQQLASTHHLELQEQFLNLLKP